MAVGTIQVLPETVTNSGTTSLSLTTASVTGTGFTISGLTLPMVLAAGQSTSFNVVFQPPSATTGGTGNVGLANTGTNSVLDIPLTGTGAAPPAMTASPNGYSFGAVAMGSTVTENETLDEYRFEQRDDLAGNRHWSWFRRSEFGSAADPGSEPNDDFWSDVFSGGFARHRQRRCADHRRRDQRDVPRVFRIGGLDGCAGCGDAVAREPELHECRDGPDIQSNRDSHEHGRSEHDRFAGHGIGNGVECFRVHGGDVVAGRDHDVQRDVCADFGGQLSGTVTVTSNASNPSLSIPLTGTAVAPPAVLTASPTSLTYTNITVGQTSSQTETIKNTGGTNATISAVAESGAGFSVSGITTPVTLTPGQSTTFTVKFAPTSATTFNGTVTVTSNASNPSLAIPLSGTAEGAPAVLTASPTSLTYTNITVGQTSSQTETIENTGGTSATISAVAATGTGFSISGITTPVTLTAGQSTIFTVKFAPASAGTFTGTVTVTSNASNPSLAIPLSGTAVTVATLTASPTSLTYTNITVGQTSSQTETIKNTGGASATIPRLRNGGRVHHFRDHDAGDVDRGTEHDVYGEVCADICRYVPGNGDTDLERIEPEPGDSIERDGGDGGHFDGVAHEFDLHEHHRGADLTRRKRSRIQAARARRFPRSRHREPG